MDHIQTLKATFNTRQRRNPHYSLRSFSRDLGISPSMLSALFHGKRSLSPKGALSIAKRLQMNSNEIDLFIKSATTTSTTSSKKKQRTIRQKQTTTIPVEETTALLLRHWYHLALLELVGIKGQSQSINSMAKALGISEDEVDLAVKSLLSIGALTSSENGRLKDNLAHVRIQDTPGAEVLREFHQQMLDEVRSHLSWRSSEEIYSQSVVLGIKKENIEELRRRIRNFVNSLADLTDDLSKDTVQAVVVHQVPLLLDSNGRKKRGNSWKN